MNSKFLSQMLSQFCVSVSTPQQYIFPTIQNLDAGAYISEILDVKEIIKPDGSLEAIDFYHQLTDSSGNVLHVRFRFYEKELPSLVSSLKQYPQVKTWEDVVGLKEDIVVSPKPTGNYLYISSRNAYVSSASKPTSGTSSANTSPHKRGGLSSRLSKSGSKPSKISRELLVSEDEEDWDDDFLDDSDD